MDLDRARQLFHLNHTEASLITTLVPRQQALLKRPDLAKVINLHVDPDSSWIYGHAPIDRRDVIRPDVGRVVGEPFTPSQETLQ